MDTMQKNDTGNRKFVPIGKVIQHILKDRGLVSSTALVRVWDIWESTVGEMIAANTVPAAFKGNLLIVHATSSSWIQQLRFLKQDIISQLNSVLGENLVQDIKFKIGPIR
jgi:predicted nucleic acid-binding Zn ribbon protein